MKISLLILLKIIWVLFWTVFGSSFIIYSLSLAALPLWGIYFIQFLLILGLYFSSLWVFDLATPQSKNTLKSSSIPDTSSQNSRYYFKEYFLNALQGFTFISLTQIYSVLFESKIWFWEHLVYIPIFFVLFVLQTFTEELIFRRFLIGQFVELFKDSKIKSSFSVLASVILSASIFSLVHISSTQILIDLLNLFLFGIFLSFMYIYNENRRLGSGIWLTSGFHLGWNFSYFLFGVQYPSQSLTESNFASFEVLHIVGSNISFISSKFLISFILCFAIWRVFQNTYHSDLKNI